jgi:uncharacterized protein YjiS (DUF1127 family)
MGKTAMSNIAVSTDRSATSANQDSSSNFSRKNVSWHAAAALQRGLERLSIWRARARTRAELMSLDDHMLKDIGFSRSEAYREYSKPFWRA